VGGLICAGLGVGFVIWVIAKAIGPGQYARLLKVGLPARGILLQVSAFKGRVQSGGLRFESRNVTIDVEVIGQSPYEANVNLLIPSQLKNDVLPGATVELRVDPKNKKNMAVIGPGAGAIGTRVVK
jgi:hypothetical protein